MSSPFSERFSQLLGSEWGLRKELARSMGVSPGYITKLKTGAKSPPNEQRLRQIAAFFKLSERETGDLIAQAAMSHPSFSLDHRSAAVIFELAALLSTEAVRFDEVKLEMCKGLRNALACNLPARDSGDQMAEAEM